jgi:hypothetical protein
MKNKSNLKNNIYIMIIFVKIKINVINIDLYNIRIYKLTWSV